MNRNLLPALVALPLGLAGGWFLHGSQVETEVIAPIPSTPAPALDADGRATLTNPKASLFYFPFQTNNVTTEGQQVAEAILQDLQGDPSGCTRARVLLAPLLLKDDNFGGEYPSLDWFCRWRLADDAEQARMEENPDGARFLDVFAADDFRPMTQYLRFKFQLPGGGPMPGPQMHWVDEFLRFNSPERDRWEKTASVLALMELRPGMTVADIGAGSGFYSFRFAEAVGPTGKVWAVELDGNHLAYLRQVALDVPPMEVVEGSPQGTGLAPGSADVVFLCSTYQTLYGSVRTEDREAWITSLKQSLKPGGRVVISENVPDGEVPPGVSPYRGISVSKQLIAAQLQAYGFRILVDTQYIPQRYLLVLDLPVNAAG